MFAAYDNLFSAYDYYFCMHIQVQPDRSFTPKYQQIFVMGPSGAERVTFDACEGSDEDHYWGHHNGIDQTHVTGS